MTAKQARTYDDGRDDRDNPIVPFRMSDRLAISKLTWWMSGVTALLLVMFSVLVMHP
jgi:hypothetical protein